MESITRKIDYKTSVSDIIAVCCVFFAASVSFNDALNSIALYMAIPLAFFCVFSKYRVIRDNTCMQFLIAVYIWVAICWPTAEDIELANREMRAVLGAFILCYVMGGLGRQKKLRPFLYLIYCVYLASAWIYAKNNILSVIDFGSQRLNDEKLNANLLAYYTFYVTIVIYLLGDMLKNKLRIIFRVLLFGVVILSFITAIYTASRQVLMIQVPLLCFLMWDRYMKKSTKSIIMLAFIIIGSIFLFIEYGEGIYDDSFLKQRSEVEVKDDARAILVKDCIELGLDAPILGHGPGNTVKLTSINQFAHNTFLELFVCTGFLGTILFLLMILYFIKIQYTRWKLTRDSLFKTFCVFGIFWMFDQFFYVFYTNLWLMSFLILVATHSEQYYLENYNNKYYSSISSKL